MDLNRQRESLSFEKVSRKKQPSRYLTWSLKNPLLIIGFVAIVMVAILWILGSNFGANSIGMSRADIGTIAAYDYKASRDFTFDRVDTEATERIRQQRMADVLPIFKWDNNYQEQTVNRFKNAFELMRNELGNERLKIENQRVARNLKADNMQSDPKRQAWADAILNRYVNDRIFDSYISTRAPNEEEIKTALHQWSLAHRDDFVQALGYSIDDKLYEWFIQQQFSDSLQNELIQDFNAILGKFIVPTKQQLDAIDRLTIQWYENGERKQRNLDKTDIAAIASLDESETRMNSLLSSQFTQPPESFGQYIKQFIRPNLAYDADATAREKQNVSDKTQELRVIEEYKKGQTIVARGNPIKQTHYDVFEKMSQIQGDNENQTTHWIALGIVMMTLLFLMWRSIRSTTSKRQNNRDILYIASVILTFTLSLKLFVLLNDVLDSVYQWPFSIVLLFPFGAGPMLVRIVVNRYYAYLFTIVSIVLTSLIVSDNGVILSYAMICAMSGCLLTERPKRSNMILKRGLLLAIIGALVSFAIYLFKESSLSNTDLLIATLLGAGGGLVSVGIVTIGLPIAESLFGYVTSNKLLELSNLEHPALKTLFLEAPGTYQHSIMVGSLNEAAADAIGANAILARVGGYYHDIGKVKNAQYFAENQRGDNPHNRLKPNMSALILKSHTKDGLEIAKKYNLPQDIRDFIATHHGTSRIEYFYQRAKEQQDRVREEDYRYPGPRPQTRETGICMVSDMVEAAVRSLPDKSPDKILVLVHKLINHKFTDGQFDECDLTLRDLNDIANALLGILNAFYHHRPEYPDQKKEREKLEAEKKSQSDSERKTSQEEKNAVQKTIHETVQTATPQTVSETNSPCAPADSANNAASSPQHDNLKIVAANANQTINQTAPTIDTSNDLIFKDEPPQNAKVQTDAILKDNSGNDENHDADSNRTTAQQTPQAAYDLAFSNQVNVFKRNT